MHIIYRHSIKYQRLLCHDHTVILILNVECYDNTFASHKRCSLTMITQKERVGPVKPCWDGHGCCRPRVHWHLRCNRCQNLRFSSMKTIRADHVCVGGSRESRQGRWSQGDGYVCKSKGPKWYNIEVLWIVHIWDVLGFSCGRLHFISMHLSWFIPCAIDWDELNLFWIC